MQVGSSLLLVAAAAVVCTLAPADARAQEPYSLSADFPLRVEDATPTKHGRWELETASLYEHTDADEDRATFQPELRWGFAPDWDLHVQSPFYAGDADRTGSGDVQVNTQWNFLKDGHDTWHPALAVQAQLNAPSGKRSEGLDSEWKAIATKTLTDQPAQDQLHANFTWIHNQENAPLEREERHIAVFGYSRRVAEGTVFVADYVWEQQRTKGRRSHIVEAGLIQDVAQSVKVSLGGGVGIGEESPDAVAGLGIRFSQ